MAIESVGQVFCIEKNNRWLHERLQDDTPDVERPEVWTNRAAAWLYRPFVMQTPDDHTP